MMSASSFSLPKHTLTCYFVRHGERIDHIDDDWVHTATTPYDPPLTRHGIVQAHRTGALISQLEQQASIAHKTEYLVLTSPFLRCVQTAQAIHEGFQQQQNKYALDIEPWRISVEPGLCEMMSENYFSEQVPDSIIDKSTRDIHSKRLCCEMVYSEDYEQIRKTLPRYSEEFQDMMARFVSTLDIVVSRMVDMRMKRRAMGAEDPRVVVVFVTHGAGIGSLLWATTLKPGSNDVDYCSLTRAELVSRKTLLPLTQFGTSRVPAYSWTVGPKAYSKHIASL
ncbi:hypothetical protein LPJ64_002934 [Coemansia asiatica]|uniref:Phosphoglycerate mutase-like protein n=1 Tax=Coemansia asiatica TaxID=1052880 RepID=A0A9W7XM20_9FUNG|nr:hypothetical protein LPJ64_002934 [Coemansia asiatica]